MISFDGHNLEDLFFVGEPEYDILPSETEFEDVPGRDGSVPKGHRWGRPSVSFTLVASGTPEERRDKFSVLGAWVNVDGARPLVIPDTPDRYYLASHVGSLNPQRYIGDEAARITFELAEPAAYGRSETIAVPSGGTVDINVGGTYPTHVSIRGTVRRDPLTGLWGLRLDEGKHIQVETGSDDPRAIAVDTELCTCSVAGTACLPTLDSDWLELWPGPHSLRNDLGTGEVAVTWTERWL